MRIRSIPKRIGDPARMLPASAAEAGQRIKGHVVAAGDRNLADRCGHIVDRDGEEALGNLLEAHVIAELACDFFEAARATPAGSSGWLPSGPNTGGNCAGSIRLRNRLQSVTVSGPPLR